VLSITVAHGRRALLTGDLEAEQELRLARDAPATLRADVLLVPHRGSSSTSNAGLSRCGGATRGAGAGGLPQPLRPPCARGRGALRRTRHRAARHGALRRLARNQRFARRALRSDDRRRYWHHGLEVARSAGTVEERETLWRSMSR
jgi:hypothetical protein